MLIQKYQDEIGIEMVPFKFMVYLPKKTVIARLIKLKKMNIKHFQEPNYERFWIMEMKKFLNGLHYRDVAKELKLSTSNFPRGFTVFSQDYLALVNQHCEWFDG